MSRIAGGMLVALVAVSCATGPSESEWERSVLETRRLQERGAYDRAATEYRRLLESADSVNDRRWVRLQLARLARDRGRARQALRRYRRIWQSAERGSIPARAMFESTTLLVDELDRAKRARKLRERLVRRYPGSSWAGRSLEALANFHRRRGDWKGLEARFERLLGRIRETKAAPELLFTLGEYLNRDADAPARALEYFRRICESYPKSTLFDDAEWEAAQIYIARNDVERALPLLRDLAARVDRSWLAGTLSSPYASRSRYELGLLHLTELDDYDRAVEHFETYVSEFPNNRLSDDSLWQMARAYRRMDRPERVRATLERLIEEYPKSRYARRARRRLGKGGDG